VRKVGSLACKEFRGGYWQDRVRMAGTMGTYNEHFYVPDSREEYSNAIDYLFDLLYPYFDAEMKKEAKESEGEESATLKRIMPGFDAEKDSKATSEAQVQAFRDVKVEIKRKLFRSLSCFLFRKKYLQEGMFIEET
jgi:hypothetical protein